MSRTVLHAKVECKSTYPFFETIAAFNSVKVAYRYARNCFEYNPDFEYRVKVGKKLFNVRLDPEPKDF